MIVLNLFTLHSLASATLSVVLAVVFYLLAVGRRGRRHELLLAHFLLVLAAISVCYLLGDNLVPAGRPATGWPGGPDAAELAWRGLWLIRATWLLALVALAVQVHFVVVYCRLSRRWQRRIPWAYVLAGLCMPVVFHPAFLAIRSQPLAATSSWQVAMPWLPHVGPLTLGYLLLWLVVQGWTLTILLFRPARPAPRMGVLGQAQLVAFAFAGNAAVGASEIVLASAGYQGPVIAPFGAVLLGGGLAAALLMDRRRAARQTWQQTRRLVATRRALGESERRYRLLADNAADVIWATDMDLQRQYFSPSVQALLGYTPEEALAAHTHDVLPPEAEQRFVRAVRPLLDLPPDAPALPVQIELPHRHKDGHIVWGQVTARLSRDERGRPTGVIGITRDITAQRTARQELHDSESRLRAILENAAAGIFLVDRDGRYVDVNAHGLAMMGRTREQLIGTSVAEMCHPDELDANLAIVAEMFAGRLASWKGETRVRSDKNGWLWADLSVSPVRGLDGGVEALVGIGFDISARRQAQRQLREAHRDLMCACENERRNLARELHDSVGQMLVAMQLSLQAAGPDVPHEVARAGETCIDLVREVRRICHGLYPPTLESMGLISALERLGEPCRHAELDFTLSFPDHLRACRWGGEVEIALFRIAQEATNNAIRHSQASAVTVEVEHRDGQLVLEVRDDGSGFRPGARAGLGMSSMRDRAEAVGARLAVESDAEGTTIRVSVPRQRPSPPTPPAISPRQSPAGVRRN